MSLKKPDVKKFAAEKNFTKLTKALSSNDEAVRKAASEALEEIIEPLIATLKNEDEDVREKAVEALVRIGGPAIEPLTIALRYGDVYARSSAVMALGRIGGPQAIEPLMAALNDEDDHVCKVIAEVLSTLK